jgi:hypothetical protein
MNRNSLLIRYDKDLRLRMRYRGARKEITRDVVRFVSNVPEMNFVGFTFAIEPELERVIDQQLEYFLPLKQPFTWKVYDHDLLPSLGEKLIAREFVSGEDPTDVMVLDLKNASPRLFEAENADIRQITTQDGLKDIIQVLDEVCGGDNTWVYQRLARNLEVRGYLSAYIAYADQKPASVAWTYFPYGHFAKLVFGCTIAAYRKQGLFASLLATRLKEVRERGYPYAVVETNVMNKPILEARGFKHLTTIYKYEWKGN